MNEERTHFISTSVELDAYAQKNCKTIKLKTSPTPIIMQEIGSMMKCVGCVLAGDNNFGRLQER